MNAWWQRWVALWDRREPPTQLALARIGVGLVACADLVYSRAAGLAGVLWSPYPAGYATGREAWLGLGGGAWWTIAVIASAAIALGAATRVACIAYAIASLELARLAPASESALDVLYRIVPIVLALSRCNARWSIDAAIARALGRPPPAEIPAWPRYLLMLQLLWVYFSAGINKTGAEWGPLGGFTALADAAADPQAARFGPEWAQALLPLTRVATLVAIAFELGAPLYLAFLYYADTADRPGRVRRLCNRLHLRWIWLALGIAFELGLAAVLRLGDFPYGMLALYPVLLLPQRARVTNVAASAT
ncbi:MAG TPA: HTTM domain-containing protein [Kofleriaceae bacterium]|nr:HTTM domain-containing protein [Kofleriaceae bacterium]